jgi:hypothetical protein
MDALVTLLACVADTATLSRSAGGAPAAEAAGEEEMWCTARPLLESCLWCCCLRLRLLAPPRAPPRRMLSVCTSAALASACQKVSRPTMGAPSARRPASRIGVIPLLVLASTSAPADSSARTTASEAYSAAWWRGLRPVEQNDKSESQQVYQLKCGRQGALAQGSTFDAGPGVGVRAGCEQEVDKVSLVARGR